MGICVGGVYACSVCVCVLCAHVYACVLVYIAEQGTASGIVTKYCQRFSETGSLTGLLIPSRLSWLTWESACLSFHSAGITATLHCVQNFCGVLGIEGKHVVDPDSHFCLF